METINTLIDKRKRLVATHKENNFTDGINSLLTDLYPDTAHFIYELLQNAEDMDATTVRFILSEDNIDFEHNGTKRDFTLSDIDAITNIGNNGQKKEDETSIGKFGVGFKAVFAYTSTPVIHSGEYHFKIKDYFVPEIIENNNVTTTDKNGVSWTKFSFPFNNPKKPKAQAYVEILESLIQLNNSSILFLKSINRIEYLVADGTLGYISATPYSDNYLTIECKKHSEEKVRSQRWLRFQKPIEILDEKGYNKKLSVAIAYELEYDDKLGKEKIIPVNGGGKTFIYFPAEKEHSGLHFNINAPFASTVARDSVRDAKENIGLIKHVAKLVVESLEEIKKLDLLSIEFLRVLPNDKDNLSHFYGYIQDFIKQAFTTNDYLPLKNGGFGNSINTIIGSAEMSSLLDVESLKVLKGVKKKWLKNANQKNSREDNFIRSLDIEEFTTKNFQDFFDDFQKVGDFLEKKDDLWLKKFYLFCANQDIYHKNLEITKFIRGIDGKMYTPTQIFIRPNGNDFLSINAPLVSKVFIEYKSNSDKECKIIRDYFIEELKIEIYSEKVEILEKLSNIHIPKNNNEVKEYLRTMLSFSIFSRNNDLDFSDENIFIYVDNGELKLTNSKQILLSYPFVNGNNEALLPYINKKLLWDGYFEQFEPKQFEVFKEFLKDLGVTKGLEIKYQSATYNPLFRTELSSKARNTGYGTDRDYTIQNLEILLRSNNIEVSKIIWSFLLKNNHREYCLARYAPNRTASDESCESSLIYYLKNFKWIPNTEGILFKPCEISEKDIHKDFRLDNNNFLIKSLGIGSDIKKLDNNIDKLNAEAKKYGKVVIDKAYLDNLLEHYKPVPVKNNNVDEKSINELLSLQTKQNLKSTSGNNGDSDGAVNNLKRREANILDTFKNQRIMPAKIKYAYSKVTPCTKEETALLRNLYNGECQMCGLVIKGHNNVSHFISKNIINTKDMSDNLKSTIKLGWNSVCLCPNCAAKYTVCSRDISNLAEQILSKEVVEGDGERIVLTFELDDKIQQISYKPKHFLSMQTIFKTLID